MFWLISLKGRDPLRDLGVDGKILKHGTCLAVTVCEDMDRINLAQDRGTVAGCCKYGNEPSGFIKDSTFFVSRRLWLRKILHSFIHSFIHRCL
jgi:hypothetical protein